MVLGHYTEGQGDHYVCLRSTPKFDCSEYEYNEPIFDIGNIQTELDEHNINVDNIQTELDEHNSDMDNIQTELDEHNSDMDNIKTELDGHNSDMDNIQTELDDCITDIATHELNSWTIWTTYKRNLTNIFLTKKVIGISFQTRYGSKLLGLYYKSAILKQMIYFSHLRL